MRKHGKYRRYSEEDILAEAKEYLKDGEVLESVARTLRVPLSTLSWHLTYPLRDIDHTLWEEVRIKVHKSKCASAIYMTRKRWGK